MNGNARAGTASADITPPVGLDLCGFGGRPSGNIGVHDKLHARALVVDDGRNAAALITCDVIGVGYETVEYVRGGVQRETAIPGANVMISASHTHSGPCTTVLRAMGAVNEHYLAFVADTMVGIVRSAFESRQEAVIRYARGPVRIGINRRERQADGGMRLGRNPVGPTAPHVDVLRADRLDGSPLAILLAHAAHPVALGAQNLYVSADFPGYAQRFVQRAYADGSDGPTAMFAQGCCGNINCDRDERTFPQAQRLGERLGAAAVKTAEYAQPIGELCVASAHETVDLPLQDPPALREAEVLVAEQRDALAGARESAERPGRVRLHEGLLEWAEQVRELAERGATDLMQPFHMQALRIGPVVFVGLPGEVFVEYAHAIEEASAAAHTVVLGYTNGCIGYVPTRAAFAEGGYEVENAIRYYGTTMLTPDCEDLVLEAAHRLLRGVCA